MVKIINVYNSGSEEYIEITNQGTAAADLSGWHVFGSKDRDDHSDDYFFPAGFVLAPGISVILYSGEGGTDSPPGHIYWTRKNVWNNDGETVYLYDAGGIEIDLYNY